MLKTIVLIDIFVETITFSWDFVQRYSIWNRL